jgi:hypothetical protein
MDAATRRLVRERAGQRCEFCRLPDVADEWPFHVDHIVARIHGGDEHVDNLSWSCTQCNLHKGANLASIDPEVAWTCTIRARIAGIGTSRSLSAVTSSV